MTDDAAPVDRHKRWRLENPDKVRAQRERYKARKRGDAPPYVKPPKTPEEDRREKQRNRTRCWYLAKRAKMAKDPEFAEKHRAAERARAMRHLEKLRADPEAYAAYLKQLRDRKRAEKGIPLDAPVKAVRLTPEERRQRNAEYKRKVYRIKHGIPLDAPVGVARKPRAKTAKPAIDQERARRAAEVEAAKAAKAAAIIVEPAPCPDPPALQELFRKASKGEPPRPFPAAGRRRSVFYLRGMY